MSFLLLGAVDLFDCRCGQNCPQSLFVSSLKSVAVPVVGIIEFEFQGESVSVMRRYFLIFFQHSNRSLSLSVMTVMFWQHNSVSAIRINCSQKTCLFAIIVGATVNLSNDTIRTEMITNENLEILFRFRFRN